MCLSHYEVLGLLRDATPKQIKHAYLEKTKEVRRKIEFRKRAQLISPSSPQLHPDRQNVQESNDADGDSVRRDRYHRVMEAYEVLSRPNERRIYDLSLTREEQAGRVYGSPIQSER